jgi:hypothetical protein
MCGTNMRFLNKANPRIPFGKLPNYITRSVFTAIIDNDKLYFKHRCSIRPPQSFPYGWRKTIFLIIGGDDNGELLFWHRLNLVDLLAVSLEL